MISSSKCSCVYYSRRRNLRWGVAKRKFLNMAIAIRNIRALKSFWRKESTILNVLLMILVTFNIEFVWLFATMWKINLNALSFIANPIHYCHNYIIRIWISFIWGTTKLNWKNRAWKITMYLASRYIKVLPPLYTLILCLLFSSCIKHLWIWLHQNYFQRMSHQCVGETNCQSKTVFWC